MTGRSRRRSVRVAVRAALLLAVAGSLTVSAGLGSTAGAQDTSGADAVDVEIAAGIDGFVPITDRMPVAVSLESERARVVSMEFESDRDEFTVTAELNAGARTVVPVIVQLPTDRVTVTVRDGGRKVGSRILNLEDNPVFLVGVGASIASSATPWNSGSIAGIEQATLVPLDGERLAEPGVLGAFTDLVMGPGDLDRLAPEMRQRLAMWVAMGGNLAIDQSRVDTLPVVDLPAAEGDRTAVEAGWVRFTGGAASRGEWSAVVEPSPTPDHSGQFDGGDFADFGFESPRSGNESMVSGIGLLSVTFLPVWVIALGAMGTSLAVGPLLWFLLRTRRRRAWMWVAAPGCALAIAATMVIVGQGVFSDATSLAVGSGVTTQFGTRGDFAVGVSDDSAQIELGTDAQVWADEPDAEVSGSGAERRATSALATNGYGYVGVGQVDLADDPLVTVEAVAGEGEMAKVSVTNNSDGVLVRVTVAGFTRSREFEDVPAGATKTLEFETSTELQALGQSFPDNGESCFMGCMTVGGGMGTRSGFIAPGAHGLVEIRGMLQSTVTVGGLRRPATTNIVARAAVMPDAGASRMNNAAVRIDAVGGEALSATFLDPNNPGPFESVPTTEPGVAGAAAPLPEGELTTAHVRISTPVATPDLECAVQTLGASLEEWRDGAWVPVTRVGEESFDRHFAEPNQVQRYRFAPMAAGEARFVRAKVALEARLPSLFYCGGAS